jgi:hypothetical protein
MNKYRNVKKPPPETEKSIMLGIVSALSFKGWRCFRMPPSIYSQKGIADLCCLRWGITAWVEVKSAKGKLSPDQRRFGEMVSDAGGIYIVARSVEYAVRVTDHILIAHCKEFLSPNKQTKLEVETILKESR